MNEKWTFVRCTAQKFVGYGKVLDIENGESNNKEHSNMTLQEAEIKLSELNTEINKLLRDREAVLKEWNSAFNTENQENIVCVDENIADVHKLYLLNGESKIFMCRLDSYDMKGDLDAFYKRVDTSMHLQSVADGRGYEIPDYQKNLVYAKVAEIREAYIASFMV